MTESKGEGVGCVEEVTFGSRALDVRGWLLSFDRAPIDRLVLSVGRKVRETTSCRINVPRPELQTELATIAGSDENCGFQMRVRISREERGQLDDALVEVTPIYETRSGPVAFGVVAPSLQLPSPDDQRAFGDDFLGMAYRLLGHCVNYADLQPDHRVLDVGCGAGRLGYALSSFLSTSGSYEGFDANARWVYLARAAISNRFPNFAFRRLDVRNAVYNPEGTLDATECSFPYPSESFDRACVISVFQHNRPRAVQQYLREVARVLRPGGQCLATCFLLGPDTIEADKKANSLDFFYPLEGSWTARPGLPEIGVAHELEAMENWIRSAGLAVKSVREGSWRGGRRVYSWQDLLVLEKPAPGCPDAARV